MRLPFRKMSGCVIMILAFALLLMALPLSVAASGGGQSAALTVSDPQIPMEELKLLLDPLTAEELEVEAKAWLLLLKEKVRQISYTEIAVKRKNLEIDSAQKMAKAADKVRQAIEKVEKAESGVTEEGSQTALQKAEDARQDAREAAEQAQQAANAAKQIEQQNHRRKEIKAAEKQALEHVQQPSAGKNGTASEITAMPNLTTAVPPSSQKVENAVETARTAAEEKARLKSHLLKNLTQLRAERTQLIDRFSVALDALKLKGGDDAVYRKYIAAVSGIAVDVSDAGAMWSTITGWLQSDQGGIRWLKNFFFFLITLICFWFLSKIIGKATQKGLEMQPRLSTLMRDVVQTVVRRTLLAVGLIVALSALEVDIGPLLAVIGAAGFVVAFALQDTLGNFASGIMILINRPFDVGDLIDVAGVYGKVVSMNLVSTTIATLDNQVVIVPNNSIWGGVITNVTGSDLRRIDMVFGIGYADDIGAAQKVLETIVNEHPLTLDNPAPVIRLNELADSSVNFICRPWVKSEDYWSVYWDITRAVKEQFDANGISIPFPQQDVHIHHVTAPQTTTETV